MPTNTTTDTTIDVERERAYALAAARLAIIEDLLTLAHRELNQVPVMIGYTKLSNTITAVAASKQFTRELLDGCREHTHVPR